MDWHELEKKKVTELREMAKEKLEISGVSGMHKPELVEALAKAMEPHKVAEGAGKTELKQQIKALKQERDQARTNHDADALVVTRRKIHRLKRKLRKSAHLTR